MRAGLGQTFGTVRLLLQLKAAAVAIAAVTLFFIQDGSWLLFAALILAPDLAMLGFLVKRETGVFCYNIAHTYIWPMTLLGIGFFLSQPLLMSIALIWIAHVAVDRAIGYGLKYPTGFKHTHLSHAES
jgi:hypothetical protein